MNVLLLLFSPLRWVCKTTTTVNNIDEFSLTSSCINCLFLIKWICLLGKEEKWYYSFSSHLSVSSSTRPPTRFLIWAHRCGWNIRKGKEIRESHSTWISPTIFCENNKMLLARFYLERITFSTSRNAEKTSLEERRQPKEIEPLKWRRQPNKTKMNRWRELTFLFFEFRRHLIRTRVSISHQKERSKKKNKLLGFFTQEIGQKMGDSCAGITGNRKQTKRKGRKKERKKF